MKKSILKLGILILLPSIIIFLIGCSTHNKLSSVSRPFYKKANKQWEKGFHLDAIFSVTKGVVADENYEKTKEFLFNNYEYTIIEILEEVKKYKYTKDTAEAARRFHIYKTLVGINSNISKMKLPLQHHKGKWQWTTEVIDYSSQASESVKYAYNVFYDYAKKRLFANRPDDAKVIFHQANKRFTTNPLERSQSKKSIVKDFCDYADENKESEDWHEAANAAYAFKHALFFDRNSIPAKTGYEYTSGRVSNLLVIEGQNYTNIGDIKSLLKANESYKAAIKWNKNNSEATALIEELKSIIAESYYSSAIEADNANSGNLMKIKNLYESALKWVPDYKDCKARIYSLSIRHELTSLRLNIEKSQNEHFRIQSRIEQMSKGVDLANATMGKITFVSDNLRKIDKTVKSTIRILNSVSAIPAAAAIKRSLTTFRTPVSNAVRYFNEVEKPIITPTKESVEKTKIIVDLLKMKVNTLGIILKNTKITILGLENCIHEINDPEILRKTEIAVKDLNKGLVTVNKTISIINGTIDGVINASKKISDISKQIKPIVSGLNKVKPVVKKLEKSAKKINKIMDKKIMGYSVRDALKLTGPLKYIMKKATKLFEPVFKEISKALPEIPGLDAYKNEIAKLQQKANVFRKESDKIKAKYKELTDIQNIISNSLNTIVDKTGCGVGFANSKADGINMIKSGSSDKYQDLKGNEFASNKNGANLQLWSIDCGKDRLLKFIPAGGDYYFIEFQNENRVLDVSGGNPKKGANLQAYSKNNTDAQKFVLIPVPGKDNTFFILSKLSGKAVDASGKKVNDNGTNGS